MEKFNYFPATQITNSSESRYCWAVSSNVQCNQRSIWIL